MSGLARRDALVGLAGAAVTLITTPLLARTVSAQPTPPKPPTAPTPPSAPSATPPPTAAAPHVHDHAAPAATGNPKTKPKPAETYTPAFAAALHAVVESTANCQRDGRVCLAHCTEHFTMGHPMEQCQRAVMNMLSVTSAMADVAGYGNASAKHISALAASCAAFCRACASACEAHKDHHSECKACMESCLACAKACEALSA